MLKGYRSKIVGYLILAGAIIHLAIDVLDGNGIDFQQHFNTIITGLGGLGIVFLRDAIPSKE